MTTNLLPISSDGGFVTAGNITTASYASPAPTISGFSSVSSDNIILQQGNIVGGVATVVDDGINSIALAPGAQMDVYGFPFSQITRGQLTISGVATPSEVNGTWYYQSVNTNTYQIYTDSTYSTLVDATGWSAYTGGGTVAIVKQVPAANIVIDSNGFLSKFTNNGQVILPGSLSTAGDISSSGNISAGQNLTAGGNLDIDGEGSIGGNLTIVGNVNFSGGGTINQITSPFGYFTGNTDGSNALYAGVPGGTIVPNAVAQFTGDANAYMQVNMQNKNHGTQASIEYVITGDLGSDTQDYIDIGFSSSTWDGTQDNSLGTAVAARDGWMYVQGGGGGGNLVLGTTTSGTKIKFNAGGPNSANTVATIDSTGFSATGNVTAGHLKGEGGNISNIQHGNVSGLGNIATINLDGSSSTVLYGNGSFAAVTAGTTLVNGNSNIVVNANSNVIISTNGNSAVMDVGADGRVRMINGAKIIGGNIVAGDGYVQFASSTLTMFGGNIQLLGGGFIKGPGGVSVMSLNSPENTSLRIIGNLAVGVSNTGNVYGGNISLAGNISGNTGGYALGYRDLPQIVASNTTLAATDGGKHYYSATAANYTLTIPNNATTSFATGTAISIVVQAAGNILVNASSGVTLYMAGNSTAANRYVNAYGMATLLKVATDTWFINGTGVN